MASADVEILVVEDSPTQAERLRHMLEAHGYAVRVAKNGREALERVRVSKPTLIISDVVMPEMDGYALCRQIKSEAPLRDTPVLLVTSLSSPRDVLKGLECGADNFIRKPYDEKYLLARIQYILTNQELRKSTRVDVGLEILFGGQKHRITAERQQIVDLLISSYEEAVRVNEELETKQVELSRSYQALEVLHRTATDLNEATSEEAVANKALESAINLPGVASGWILLSGGGEPRLLAARGLPASVEEAVTTDGDCECMRRLATEELHSALNIGACERLQTAFAGGESHHCHAAVPLSTGGRTIGCLNLAGPGHKEFDEEELRILSSVGHQVAIALERAQLLGGLEKEVEARTAALHTEVERRKRVQEEREQFFALSRDLFCIADFSGHFKLVNPAWQEVLGFSADELLAQPYLEFVHPEDREATLADTKRLLAGSEVISFENRYACKDGSYRRLRWSATAPRGMQLIYAGARDVTEERLLEQQLRQAQKMEAIGRLAGGVAHDFNNMLGVIIGYSDHVLDGLDPADPLRKGVEEIKEAGLHAASLTHQLLAFSRKQVLEPKVLDLNEIVRECENILRRLIDEDVKLATELEPDLGRVKVDPGQVQQILMNLAVNARDAMPRGGKLTIETANVELDEPYARLHLGATAGSFVMLAVTDTGCGMDAETQSHIFEPFFTTKEPGKGTGLGLATVFGIVKQSGGYIWVYSELEQGTTFKVYLPRVEETAEHMAKPKAQRRLPRGVETILAVEDAAPLRQLTRKMLESLGYRVLEAKEPIEALELAIQQEGPIHLLLTDVVMPSLSGPELANRLACQRPEMRVLYVSGYPKDAIVHHGVLQPGIAFLQKPFTREALAFKLREVLGGRAQSDKKRAEPDSRQSRTKPD
ncbi:MAG: response regulator [Candidatus Acidiferrales bacterium]